MFTNNLIVLLKLLRDYNLEIEDIIRNDNKEFNNEDLSVLIENIMIDLKNLDRNLN
jgi:hypothetical protein